MWLLSLGYTSKLDANDSVSKRYSECGLRVWALITKNEQVCKTVMKFCMARLSPSLIGQIMAEASLDVSEDYMRSTYNEYVERRNTLIDGLNRIEGVYAPIPMGLSIRWLSCQSMIAINSANGV